MLYVSCVPVTTVTISATLKSSVFDTMHSSRWSKATKFCIRGEGDEQR